MFVDVGAPVELEVTMLDHSPEDVVHVVTESVMGFDLVEMLRARDDGALDEMLLRVE